MSTADAWLAMWYQEVRPSAANRVPCEFVGNRTTAQIVKTEGTIVLKLTRTLASPARAVRGATAPFPAAVTAAATPPTSLSTTARVSLASALVPLFFHAPVHAWPGGHVTENSPILNRAKGAGTEAKAASQYGGDGAKGGKGGKGGGNDGDGGGEGGGAVAQSAV